MTIRFPILLALVAALALAGCASPSSNTGDKTGYAQPPASISTAAAGQLLKTAVTDLPEQFGMEMSIKNGSRELMSMKGYFDNATQTSYIELTAAPDLLAGKGGGEAAMMGGLFASGFAMYTAKDASLIVLNGTAFAAPPGNDSNGMMGSQNPLDSFKDMGDPSKLFSNISGDANGNSTVIKSVTPLVYRNHPALELAASTTKDGKTYDAKAIVFTDPTLLAHVEGNFPPESNATDDPFSAGTGTADFYYGNEVKTKVPEKVSRALGLAYSSGHAPFDMSGSSDDSGSTATWTFLHSGGVKLADAVIEIKDDSNSDSSGMGGMAPPDPASMPTLWSMALSDVTKEKDGVALSFDDHDHDSLVSMGDTLTITWPQDGPRPNAVLKDNVTGLYVVPGAPLGLALGLLGLAAIALRRK